MTQKNKPTKSMFLATSCLGLIIICRNLTFQMDLNKAVGWGWDFREYFGFSILILFVISLKFTTIAIVKEKFTFINSLSILIHIVTGINVIAFWHQYFFFEI